MIIRETMLEVADEVTDMEVDKVANMMAKIPNENLYLWRWCLVEEHPKAPQKQAP